jgi:ribosomal protein S14
MLKPPNRSEMQEDIERAETLRQLSEQDRQAQRCSRSARARGLKQDGLTADEDR